MPRHSGSVNSVLPSVRVNAARALNFFCHAGFMAFRSSVFDALGAASGHDSMSFISVTAMFTAFATSASNAMSLQRVK